MFKYKLLLQNMVKYLQDMVENTFAKPESSSSSLVFISSLIDGESCDPDCFASRRATLLPALNNTKKKHDSGQEYKSTIRRHWAENEMSVVESSTTM